MTIDHSHHILTVVIRFCRCCCTRRTAQFNVCLGANSMHRPEDSVHFWHMAKGGGGRKNKIIDKPEWGYEMQEGGVGIALPEFCCLAA